MTTVLIFRRPVYLKVNIIGPQIHLYFFQTSLFLPILISTLVNFINANRSMSPALKHFNGSHCRWLTGLRIVPQTRALHAPCSHSSSGHTLTPSPQLTPSHPSFRSQLLNPSLNKSFPTNQVWLKSSSFFAPARLCAPHPSTYHATVTLIHLCICYPQLE